MAEKAPSPSLEEISQRLDRIEQTLARLDRVMSRVAQVDAAATAHVPAAVATAADIVDDLARRADRAGIDLDARVTSALRLIERLTEPEVTASIEAVLDRIDRIKILVEQADALPDLLAMITDIADEFLLRAAGHGLDIETIVRSGVDVFARLARLLQSSEFQNLLDSGVLDARVVQVVGQLGSALSEAHGELGGRAGWMALWRATRDPEVQRTLDFSVRFLRHLGNRLESSDAADDGMNGDSLDGSRNGTRRIIGPSASQE